MPPAIRAFLDGSPVRSMVVAAALSSSLARPPRSTARQRRCTAFRLASSMMRARPSARRPSASSATSSSVTILHITLSHPVLAPQTAAHTRHLASIHSSHSARADTDTACAHTRCARGKTHTHDSKHITNSRSPLSAHEQEAHTAQTSPRPPSSCPHTHKSRTPLGDQYVPGPWLPPWQRANQSRTGPLSAHPHKLYSGHCSHLAPPRAAGPIRGRRRPSRRRRPRRRRHCPSSSTPPAHIWPRSRGCAPRTTPARAS